MKRFFIILLGCILTISSLVAQDWKDREDLPDYFRRPEKTEKSLFFIQRNLNAHTIVYDLNLEPDGTINTSDPLDNYWRKFANTGARKPLTWLESWLAYGYRAKFDKKKKTFRIKLRAHKERYITLRQEEGKWKAVMQINNEESYLTNIYAYADESGIFPDVLHVDLYGINVKTGLVVKERIYD